ncbi:MAG: transglutaminase-like domain-containing protein [Pirellulales bacterium]
MLRHLAAASLLAMLLGVAVGCTGEQPSRRHMEAQMNADTAGDALIEDVADTLQNLDRFVSLDLRPSEVVLDASTSRDRQTVMAVLGANPEGPQDVYNYLYITSRNGRLAELRVARGDRVRYFVNVDEYGKRSAIEVPVAGIAGDNALLLAEGLPQAVDTPTRVEIWRYGADKVQTMMRRMNEYLAGRGEPIDWEPTPDEGMLDQIVERLNHWSRRTEQQVEWTLDPLFEKLPDELRQTVDAAQFSQDDFTRYDGRFLQEAAWSRDISTWARGGGTDPVEQAAALFDWTVRNIQLETRAAVDGRFHRPWQTLMYGRGTAEERAWVFALLCRQQGLPIVMVVPRGESPIQERPALPALWYDQELYLFDPWLGLPIRAVDNPRVATLSQVRDDEKLLASLDAAGMDYPLTSQHFEQVDIEIPAAPMYLAKRMKRLQSQFAGRQKLVLNVAASALAEEVSRHAGVGEVRLWELPFRTPQEQRTRQRPAREAELREVEVFVWRPTLWKARVLYFQGPGERENRPDSGFAEAIRYFRELRPPDSAIEAVQTLAWEIELVRTAKLHASYFLGLLTYEDSRPQVAAGYFDERTLQADPDGPWTSGARYNLARAHEQMDEPAKAAELLKQSESAQRHGDHLRARWLEDRSAAASPE